MRHRTISLTVEDEARLLEALRKDRGASFSHWLVSLGHKRADELGVAERVAVTQTETRKPGRTKRGG